MLSYEVVRKNRRQFLSMSGMEVELFEELHGAYQKQWHRYISEYTVAGEQRNRPYRRRKDGILSKTEDQLFFVLHYLKSNAIQEHHAASYGMAQSQCNGWLHLLLHLLHQALDALKQLPERDSSRLTKALKGLKEVFIDGTERDIDRPWDAAAQRVHYSGKKNAIR